jgi:hypothetical protein
VAGACGVAAAGPSLADGVVTLLSRAERWACRLPKELIVVDG